MRGAPGVAVVCVSVVFEGCGLGLAGLGEGPDASIAADGGDAGGSVDVIISLDAIVLAETGNLDDSTSSAPEAAAVDSSSAEADVDAVRPPPSDGNCAGVNCGGACTADLDCRSCPGAPLLCTASNTCGGDCSSCGATPIQCFACDANRANPIGTCEPATAATFCLDTDYVGVYAGGQDGTHCGCTTEADCPGDFQVCIPVGNGGPLGCFTCGETDTQGFACKNGGRCNAPQSECH